jgi:Zn-finger nucleic acid-binding protein
VPTAGLRILVNLCSLRQNSQRRPSLTLRLLLEFRKPRGPRASHQGPLNIVRGSAMKCPVCDVELVPGKRDGIAMEICPSCKGMWLSRQELEELEDEVFDLGDDEKGTLIFSATVTSRKCPQCSKPMKGFKYRLYGLAMDCCEDGHGFWLDADEDKRILALMKEEEAESREKGFRRRPMGGRSAVYALRILPRQNALLAGWAPGRGFRPRNRQLDASAAVTAAIAETAARRAHKNQSR